jgi:hypothetical protein
MHESKTDASTKAEPKPDRTARVGDKLAPAAESTDPAVHQLLAEIQTAQMNDNKDAEAAAREDLRALGYE